MPVVIITGGTRGIGRSLVIKFASEGFDIVTCARNEKDLVDLKSLLINDYPSIRSLVVKCDVSIKEEVINFGKQALKEMGTPDVLINNAGIFLPGSILGEEEGGFEQLIHINLASAYHLTRVIVPAMISKKQGYIFNMCSTASFVPYTNGGSYCISKFGLLGFSKVLREEMKEHNIRVSAIMPGATLTSSWEGTTLPPERFMKPNDIAKLIFDFYKTPEAINIEEIIIRPFKGDIT